MFDPDRMARFMKERGRAFKGEFEDSYTGLLKYHRECGTEMDEYGEESILDALRDAAIAFGKGFLYASSTRFGVGAVLTFLPELMKFVANRNRRKAFHQNKSEYCRVKRNSKSVGTGQRSISRKLQQLLWESSRLGMACGAYSSCYLLLKQLLSGVADKHFKLTYINNKIWDLEQCQRQRQRSSSNTMERNRRNSLVYPMMTTADDSCISQKFEDRKQESVVHDQHDFHSGSHRVSILGRGDKEEYDDDFVHVDYIQEVPERNNMHVNKENSANELTTREMDILFADCDQFDLTLSDGTIRNRNTSTNCHECAQGEDEDEKLFKYRKSSEWCTISDDQSRQNNTSALYPCDMYLNILQNYYKSKQLACSFLAGTLSGLSVLFTTRSWRQSVVSYLLVRTLHCSFNKAMILKQKCHQLNKYHSDTMSNSAKDPEMNAVDQTTKLSENSTIASGDDKLSYVNQVMLKLFNNRFIQPTLFALGAAQVFDPNESLYILFISEHAKVFFKS